VLSGPPLVYLQKWAAAANCALATPQQCEGSLGITATSTGYSSLLITGVGALRE